jgi:formiminotetrahydrofolate cyclodeaminase
LAIRRDPDARLGKLLAGLASDQPVPAGGSAAAAVVALAAALVEKVAKLSTKQWAGAAKLVGLATTLRRTAEELVDADAFAYTEFVVARRAARGLNAEAEQELESARARTINLPLDTIRNAVETVEVASALAESGNPNLRSDAAVACTLAIAGAQAALITMRANLPDSSRDPRLVEARRLVRAASSRLRSLPARGRASARGRARGRVRGNPLR